MRNFTVAMFIMLFSVLVANAQNVVKGIVLNGDSEEPLQGVSVSVKDISAVTDASGAFTLQNLANGRQVVVVKLNGFETQNYPVQLAGKTVDLGTIMMYEDVSEDLDLSTITITDDELNDDTSAADNISGLLQASRDVYSRTAAFEWSGSFYRIRGLDSENGKVLINGVEMNKLYNGRPQWSNWGGLNDVLRNQEFSNGLTPSNYTFGGVLGSTNISTRASEYRAGTRISYASSNRSYSHRVMGTYTSGLLENGWAIAVAGSRRAANEGFVDGTFYDANSIFASIEKQLNDKHSLNLTVIAAENKRGKNSPNTQEVFDLKGIKYNPYWGYQNGKLRNSRVRHVYEPIVMLNHYWNITENTTLSTNASYQFGRNGNSRIHFNGARIAGTDVIGGGLNPDPTYYQKLPSYALRNGTGNEYELLQAFQNNGQLLWDDMIAANLAGSESTNSKYILYEDRNDDKQFTVNSILNSNLTDNITLNAKVKYSKLKSENFAEVMDLLGGEGFLDVDTFGATIDEKQSDLRNPNRIVGEGDKFAYNYELDSEVMGAFAQGQFKYNKVDFYIAGDVSRTTHQRNGLYQNGTFANSSFGKSEELEFTNYGAKIGATYKFSGRHLFDINAGYLTKAPTLRNSFSNSRENNNTVDGLTSEKVMSFDASYILRTPMLQAKLTGYYTGIKDATEISFFYADGIGGDNTAFVQEVMTGIEKLHIGAELGIEAQVTPTFKLKAAANFGQYTYNNNPTVYLTSDRPNPNNPDSKYFLDPTTSYLKDYKIASGPQKAYSFGFEYRDPDYWWVGVTGNFLDDTYVDVAPLKRTSNFALDSDGIQFADYDPVVARKLLAQEEFDNYFVLNAVGGKSWKIGDKYVGFFASISNILNKEYKSGGFEQGRSANYQSAKADGDLAKPLFGNKYWYGRGTTYFLNVYLRF